MFRAQGLGVALKEAAPGNSAPSSPKRLLWPWGFMVCVLEFRFYGSWFMVHDSWFTIYGVWFMDYGLRLGV